MRKIRSKGRAETFGERMQRYQKEFRDKFAEIAGRPPTFNEEETGYDMYYTDRYGPWEAAKIVAAGKKT